MPRFTLRTLLAVVTLIAIALGWFLWQHRIAQERSDLLDMVVSNGGWYAVLAKPVNERRFTYVWIRKDYVQAGLPSRSNEEVLALEPGPYRRWLNDRTIPIIQIPSDLLPTIGMHARSLFPEAEISDTSMSFESVLRAKRLKLGTAVYP